MSAPSRTSAAAVAILTIVIALGSGCAVTDATTLDRSSSGTSTTSPPNAPVTAPSTTAPIPRPLPTGPKPGDRSPRLDWTPTPSDRDVSQAAATARAAPVLQAVATALGDLDPHAAWPYQLRTITPTQHRHDPCVIEVALRGSVTLDFGDGGAEIFQEVVVRAASPYGYSDIREYGKGGPGILVAGVGDDGTIFSAAHNSFRVVSLVVKMPAGPSAQCHDE